MRYVQAPIYWSGVGKAVYLAGGITGCPPWQEELKTLLEGTDFTIINPLQSNFPINDPSAAERQIKWEYVHLRKASLISFWFPSETLCPIALFELGAWSNTGKPIAVGVHPDYQRRRDVEIQMHLVRPEMEVVYSIPDLAREIIRLDRETPYAVL